MPGAKRRKLARQPHVQLTPEIAFAFEQIKKLEKQCGCADAKEECSACRLWWQQMAVVRNALKLSPVFWPCLPPPRGECSEAARALYAELDNALG
jgi:hypothetical protein